MLKLAGLFQNYLFVRIFKKIRSYSALRAVDLDWIVGSGRSSGENILWYSQPLASSLRRSVRICWENYLFSLLKRGPNWPPGSKKNITWLTGGTTELPDPKNVTWLTRSPNWSPLAQKMSRNSRAAPTDLLRPKPSRVGPNRPPLVQKTSCDSRGAPTDLSDV